MKELGRLPRYKRQMLERARLNQHSGKYIVTLPAKEDRNIPINPLNARKSTKLVETSALAK